jgi:WD40 repeat protein
MLATGGMDYKAKLWDTNTGRELATLDANGCTVRSVAFSEDGTRLATGAEVLVSGQIVGTELKLWDVATGQVTATIACVGFGTPLAFSPDGTTLAVATGELLLVDVAAAQTIGKLPGSGTTCVAFSPDGRLLATGEIGWDSKTSHHSGNVRLWDLSTRREQAVFKGHSDWVSALSFSPDGQTLASASWDGSVILWNTESGARQATIAGHTVPLLIKASEVVYGSRPSSRFRVNSVVISRDGKQIAVAHEDGIVDVWDRETIEKLSRQSR